MTYFFFSFVVALIYIYHLLRVNAAHSPLHQSVFGRNVLADHRNASKALLTVNVSQCSESRVQTREGQPPTYNNKNN